MRLFGSTSPAKPGELPGVVLEQEPEGVDLRRIAVIVATTLTVMTGAVGVAYLLLPEVPLGEAPEGDEALRERQGEVLITRFRRRAMGLERHREARQHLLEYGWVDEEQGVVHVPVEAAMELYLERSRRPERAPDAGAPSDAGATP